MALNDIFEALERQAQRDIDEVLAEARARAAALVGEAEIEAEAIRTKHHEEAEATVSGRCAHTLNSARLEARRRLAGVRQEAVAAVFARARERLGIVRGSDGYPELFSELIEEALEGVGGDAVVHVDPRDIELARAALRRNGVEATLVTDLTTTGGAVVATDGERVLRRNTLEDRFDKFAASAQSDVARMLFS